MYSYSNSRDKCGLSKFVVIIIAYYKFSYSVFILRPICIRMNLQKHCFEMSLDGVKGIDPVR